MILVLAAAAWVLGVVAGALGWQHHWVALVVPLPLAVALVVTRQFWRVAALVCVCAALFAAGGTRFESELPPSEPQGVAAVNDESALTVFRAVVTDEPDRTESFARVRTKVREVYQGSGWQPASGGVLLRIRSGVEYKYGDLLEVAGRLETPPTFPDFDYRQYLARRGISSIVTYPHVDFVATGRGNDLMKGVHALRRELSSALEEALPEPEASLAQGILLGTRSALPSDLNDALNATGTSHIIALSGYNVMLLAGGVIAALAWLTGRRNAAVLSLAAVIVYTVLTGASPSLVRAAIMGSLYLVATLLGRPNSGAVSLLLAAAVMTGLDPLIVQDVSFQLSFAAAAGLVYLSPLLHTRCDRLLLSRLPSPNFLQRGPVASLYEIAIVTLAATAATLPLIALHFQRISLVALPANLAVLPVFPLIMLTTAVTALAGLAADWVALPCGWVAWLGLAYMVGVVQLLDAVPFASLEVRGFGMGHAIIAYAFLGVASWSLMREPPGSRYVREVRAAVAQIASVVARPLRPVPALPATCALAAAAALVWTAVLTPSDPLLEVVALDVGQGDAIFIRTPAGHELLVDGGPDGEMLQEALAGQMDDDSLEMVVLTHPDSDHLAGLLDVLEEYDVEQVLAAASSTETELYVEWRQLIAQEEVDYTEASSGAWIDVGHGATLSVLSPPADAPAGWSDNDRSLVLKLTWGGVAFLLTGDMEAAAEEQLLASDIDVRATVLKVAHHGSLSSTSEAFLEDVKPAVAVISVGDENRFGHPAARTLMRLSNALVVRTDRQGDVTLTTDGERLWLDTEHPLPTP